MPLRDKTGPQGGGPATGLGLGGCEPMAKKWIQGAIKRPGALRKYFGKKKGEKIGEEEMSKAHKGGSTRLKRMINLARTLKKLGRKK